MKKTVYNYKLSLANGEDLDVLLEHAPERLYIKRDCEVEHGQYMLAVKDSDKHIVQCIGFKYLSSHRVDMTNIEIRTLRLKLVKGIALFAALIILFVLFLFTDSCYIHSSSIVFIDGIPMSSNMYNKLIDVAPFIGIIMFGIMLCAAVYEFILTFFK